MHSNGLLKLYPAMLSLPTLFLRGVFGFCAGSSESEFAARQRRSTTPLSGCSQAFRFRTPVPTRATGAGNSCCARTTCRSSRSSCCSSRYCGGSNPPASSARPSSACGQRSGCATAGPARIAVFRTSSPAFSAPSPRLFVAAARACRPWPPRAPQRPVALRGLRRHACRRLCRPGWGSCCPLPYSGSC